ncbi:MAG TPA: DUF4252 domain-containing protein [Steroidobacteraceae bacterium]|nr:DUF4252 domain-containing protein [Steroidobacteraceae bacterium]
MPKIPLPALAAAALLVLPAAAGAAGPELRIPDFSHLTAHARESTDVTLDGFLLRLAQHFAAREEQDDELSILKDIKSVRVRNFEFDSEGAYSRDDIEAVRRQLNSPGWSPLATVHRREPREDVDVFLNTADGKILGLAVVASEPRSFTIVNIVGNIDLDKLARLEGQLGIPKVTQEE